MYHAYFLKKYVKIQQNRHQGACGQDDQGQVGVHHVVGGVVQTLRYTCQDPSYRYQLAATK